MLTRSRKLFIYPIKSLGPVEVTTAEVTNEGLRFDRQYILVKQPVDPSAGIVQHVTIKNNWSLGLFRTSIDKSWSQLTITHIQADDNAVISIPLTPSPLSLFRAATFRVSIFGTQAPGIDMGERIASYFSRHLNFPARLLYIGGNGQREIPGAVFKAPTESVSFSVNDKLLPQRIRFADASPLLITSTASEEDARRRLPPAARGGDVILRFRSNIHVDVGDEQGPYEEDGWGMLAIRSQLNSDLEVSVRCLFKAVRCLSLNADLVNGGMCATPEQLYGLLMRDRRVNEKLPHKPVFGQYACAGPSGAVLRVGDEVVVTSRVHKSPTPLLTPAPNG
ncbi:hypothetical protein BDY17DRAFT_249543 [Neohortaea acidophila]|uniref:MOSC domain-containing protein n=1 Tax=Neohortaea acidophila TaxID=245834 RepID=A0A6A6PXL6_9PEZI|nr:uncharacterized protein BDY17DRAFT_249543 [Neohortaea acidophila]KAF2484491.1 hypothetical protein BDY17DRAFT_249543 [Neohortaea acidophila]